MYGKIFSDIFDSSIMVHGGDAVYVFIALIVLADAEGYVRITAPALSIRIGKSLPEVEKALAALESPDPHSTTPTEDGRRIIPLRELTGGEENRGWWIVNYLKYREIARKRERSQKSNQRVQRWRQRNADVTLCNAVQRSVTPVEEEEEVEEEEVTDRSKLGSFDRCPVEELVTLYHDMLPTLPRVLKLTNKRRGLLRARWKEHPHLDLWRQYFAIVARSRFLTGRTNGSADRAPFRADLGWLIGPENFAKVLEGKYDEARN